MNIMNFQADANKNPKLALENYQNDYNSND